MAILSINNKIVKRQVKNKDGSSEAGRTSDIENQVAQAILDIQNNADAANKEALMKLYITGAKEFDVGGKNAIVISIQFFLKRPHIKKFNFHPFFKFCYPTTTSQAMASRSNKNSA